MAKAIFAAEVSSPPLSKVSYHSSDFPFSDLISAGEAYEASLKLNQASPPPLQPSPPTTKEVEIGEGWDDFHTTHNTAQFFKAKRYIVGEFPCILERLCLPSPTPSPSQSTTLLLEVGCGAGAALLPILNEVDKIISSSPSISKHIVNACAVDISPRAINLLHASPSFNSTRVQTQVCDISKERVSILNGGTVDVSTLIFTLSAVPPERHLDVLREIRRVMKFGGILCFRDYGIYDMTHLRFPFTSHISNRTFLRGDNTLTTFFEISPSLTKLFEVAGFNVDNVEYALVELKNRKSQKESQRAMRRCFVHLQAVAV